MVIVAVLTHKTTGKVLGTLIMREKAKKGMFWTAEMADEDARGLRTELEELAKKLGLDAVDVAE